MFMALFSIGFRGRGEFRVRAGLDVRAGFRVRFAPHWVYKFAVYKHAKLKIAHILSTPRFIYYTF